MPYLNDNVYDQGLVYAQTNGTKLEICSAEPANYAGIAAVSLGNKTLTVGAPGNGTPSGRKVTVPSISDGSVTASGNATHYALSDGTGTLIAAGTLTNSQNVVSGNSFTLNAFDITLLDAVSA